MSNHEYFRQLSALAATGQLSSDEDRELDKHLNECESCRVVHDDYSHLVQHQMPRAVAMRPRMKAPVLRPFFEVELRDRFLGRARAEGIDFSAEAEKPERRSYSGSWRTRLLVAPAFAVLTLIAVLGIWVLRKHQPAPLSVAAHQTRDNEKLHYQLDALHQTIELESDQLAQVRHEKVLSEESLKEDQRQLLQTQAEAKRLFAELQAANTHGLMLETTDQQKDAVITDLRGQNDELSRTDADNLSELVIQEQRVRDLTESLNQQAMNLERERQLMAVTKDVRQLMGARNLHILDVRDVNVDSRSAKAFGRVFYAEGQSLIFYAFDLPSGGLSPAKYTFQAWGERDPDSQSPRNLGTFEVDDHELRRWVLKVENPDLLVGIQSVFVTAEPLHDAKEPRGKKLLYAYIAGQPNHP
jgi:hypothetical protein